LTSVIQFSRSRLATQVAAGKDTGGETDFTIIENDDNKSSELGSSGRNGNSPVVQSLQSPRPAAKELATTKANIRAKGNR